MMPDLFSGKDVVRGQIEGIAKWYAEGDDAVVEDQLGTLEISGNLARQASGGDFAHREAFTKALSRFRVFERLRRVDREKAQAELQADFRTFLKMRLLTLLEAGR